MNSLLIRLCDLVFSVVALGVLSPVLLFVACYIYFMDGFPVIYRQIRVGQFKKDFELLKFRTMRKNSDQKKLITIGIDDPRIFPGAKKLREYKIDELPQLVNVIRGEMSIVGPRPEVQRFVEFYTEEQKAILSVKPGITDVASIEFFNEDEILGRQQDPENYYINHIMPKKISLNLCWIENQTFFHYLLIMSKTLAKIVSRSS